MITAGSGFGIAVPLSRAVIDACFSPIGGFLETCPRWMGRYYFFVAFAIAGLSLYLFSVVLPAMIAPTHRRVTELAALSAVVAITVIAVRASWALAALTLCIPIAGVVITSAYRFYKFRRRRHVA